MSGPHSVDGVRLDIEHSTLVLDGRSFPAGVICDVVDGMWWGGANYMNDPAWAHGWSVIVPMENGAHVAVVLDDGVGPPERKSQGLPVGEATDAGLHLHLHAPVWVPLNERDDDPEPLRLVCYGRQLTERRGAGYVGVWSQCDPEWAADHLARLSTMSVSYVREGRIPVRLHQLGEALTMSLTGGRHEHGPDT